MTHISTPKRLTEEDRSYAEDIGAGICEECQTLFEPVPGYVNYGHQCNENGLDDKWILPDAE